MVPNSYDFLKNLKYVAKKMLIEQNNLVLMYQTHSNKVIRINKKNFRKKTNQRLVIHDIKVLFKNQFNS